MNGEDACLRLRVLIFIKFHYIHFSQLEWGERGGDGRPCRRGKEVRGCQERAALWNITIQRLCASPRASRAHARTHTHTRNRTENQNEYFFGAFWFVLNFFRFFHVDFFTACRFLHLLLLLLLLLLIYQGTETKRLGLLPG